MLDTKLLDKLLSAYATAPQMYKATKFWDGYQMGLIKEIEKTDLNEIRSGKYPIFATFGFNDVVYTYHVNLPAWKRIAHKLIHKVIGGRPLLPYRMTVHDIRDIAYHHCELYSQLCGAKPITTIESSTFGSPADLFEKENKKYTIQFLRYYLRYCFAEKHIKFRGDETIIELGSGSGYQTEVLKKMYPDLTILCFDLPVQLFLCENYLSNVLGADSVVSAEKTSDWQDLSKLEKGKVHFFGSWQMPLTNDFKFDLFWNAASFGEMEPAVVANYLNHIKGNCDYIYLMQVKSGSVGGVKDPITYDDYLELLSGYDLLKSQPGYDAHKRLTGFGGYFEGLWRVNRD